MVSVQVYEVDTKDQIRPSALQLFSVMDREEKTATAAVGLGALLFHSGLSRAAMDFSFSSMFGK